MSAPYYYSDQVVKKRWLWYLTPAETACVLALTTFMNAQTREAWPSAKTLADLTGLVEHSVYRALDGLRAYGLVDWEERRRPGRSRTYTVRVYSLPAEVPNSPGTVSAERQSLSEESPGEGSLDGEYGPAAESIVSAEATKELSTKYLTGQFTAPTNGKGRTQLAESTVHALREQVTARLAGALKAKPLSESAFGTVVATARLLLKSPERLQADADMLAHVLQASGIPTWTRQVENLLRETCAALDPDGGWGAGREAVSAAGTPDGA